MLSLITNTFSAVEKFQDQNQVDINNFPFIKELFTCGLKDVNTDKNSFARPWNFQKFKCSILKISLLIINVILRIKTRRVKANTQERFNYLIGENISLRDKL